jgi:hypothetical protein
MLAFSIDRSTCSDVMMHCALLDADAEHRPNVLASYRLLHFRDGWVRPG